jgi:hypothetical protein
LQQLQDVMGQSRTVGEFDTECRLRRNRTIGSRLDFLRERTIIRICVGGELSKDCRRNYRRQTARKLHKELPRACSALRGQQWRVSQRPAHFRMADARGVAAGSHRQGAATPACAMTTGTAAATAGMSQQCCNRQDVSARAGRDASDPPDRGAIMLGTILLVLLILLLLGALPAWPHSRGWGYYPSGGLGLILLIVIIVLLLGRA